ncbi:MAG TPA: hypothetical protein VJ987_03565, partial [Anaerolineales bacterium]|nr:hypothetical protein [Anaerolineales bacterium]
MTLQDQYNKWKETTLKRSLDKFNERRERFEYSSGLEVPRLAIPPEADSASSASTSPTAPLSEESYLNKLGFPGEYPYTRGV